MQKLAQCTKIIQNLNYKIPSKIKKMREYFVSKLQFQKLTGQLENNCEKGKKRVKLRDVRSGKTKKLKIGRNKRKSQKFNFLKWGFMIEF